VSRTGPKKTESKKTDQKKKRDLAGEAFAEGMRLLRANPALAAVDFGTCRSETCTFAPHEGLLVVDSDATVHAHPDRLAAPGAWPGRSRTPPSTSASGTSRPPRAGASSPTGTTWPPAVS
jgi:hypothetical protein